MSKIAYVFRKFTGGSQELITKANGIIDEYQKQGLRLTLRQLYYQFVSRGWIRNTQREYKRLGSVINDARLAGLIDWEAIEDRTRNVQLWSSWESPERIIDVCAQSFRLNPWDTQPYHVEVWIEKEALLGVISEICEQWRVPYFACKGYVSQSVALGSWWNRMRYAHNANKQIIILHLGDHDPSGLDMSRDIGERLGMFAGTKIHIRRLALNWGQIQMYNPPPNPAKMTDARFNNYESQYGGESWELDALEPKILRDLIDKAIEPLIDKDECDKAIRKENADRKLLEQVSENWSNIVDFLKGTT